MKQLVSLNGVNIPENITESTCFNPERCSVIVHCKVGAEVHRPYANSSGKQFTKR